MISYIQPTDSIQKNKIIEVFANDKNKIAGSCCGFICYDENEVQKWLNSKKAILDEELFLQSLLPIAILKDLKINNNKNFLKYGVDLNEKFIEKIKEFNCKSLILETEISETISMSLANWYENNDFKPIGYINSNPILLRLFYR